MNSADINLYTTMSIFVSKAPQLINHIERAIIAENMKLVEDHAAQLIAYSSNANLEGFSQRIKNLIIAARENKPHTAETLTADIKLSFEKLTKPMELPA